MSDHTPGPLVRIGDVRKCEIGGFVAIGRAGEAPTAYVANGADADLYAAAPDLLAVAIATALFFADTDSPLGARARAALLKAEGRSNA